MTLFICKYSGSFIVSLKQPSVVWEEVVSNKAMPQSGWSGPAVGSTIPRQTGLGCLRKVAEQAAE